MGLQKLLVIFLVFAQKHQQTNASTERLKINDMQTYRRRETNGRQFILPSEQDTAAKEVIYRRHTTDEEKYNDPLAKEEEEDEEVKLKIKDWSKYLNRNVKSNIGDTRNVEIFDLNKLRQQSERKIFYNDDDVDYGVEVELKIKDMSKYVTRDNNYINIKEDVDDGTKVELKVKDLSKYRRRNSYYDLDNDNDGDNDGVGVQLNKLDASKYRRRAEIADRHIFVEVTGKEYQGKKKDLLQDIKQTRNAVQKTFDEL